MSFGSFSSIVLVSFVTIYPGLFISVHLILIFPASSFKYPPQNVHADASLRPFDRHTRRHVFHSCNSFHYSVLNCIKPLKLRTCFGGIIWCLRLDVGMDSVREGASCMDSLEVCSQSTVIKSNKPKWSNDQYLFDLHWHSYWQPSQLIHLPVESYSSLLLVR